VAQPTDGNSRGPTLRGRSDGVVIKTNKGSES